MVRILLQERADVKAAVQVGKLHISAARTHAYACKRARSRARMHAHNLFESDSA